MKMLATLIIVHLLCTVSYGQSTEVRSAIEKSGGRVEAIPGGLEVSFHLGRRNVSDSDLIHVAALEGVVVLNLKKTNISSEGLAHLSKMYTLRKLHLELTNVDDTGLKHLSGLTKLHYLNLFGTEVSDNGVNELLQLKSLTHLYVWETMISQNGIRKLRNGLPTTKIVTGINLATIVLPDPDAPVVKPNARLKFVATRNISDAPKSTNGENIEVVFENTRNHKIKIIWIGYDGKLKAYGELAAGASRTQNSYENNTWLITDMKDKALGYFICEDQRALAIIP